MKKSDVKKWVKALRSGEYRQGEASLCNEDEISGECVYCCLGVACDILAEDNWVKPRRLTTWSVGKYEEFVMPATGDKQGWGHTETTSFPSLKTLKEMGLDVAYAQELAELNDRGWSFERIANKIERDLL
jgi:hypothetical protein